MILIFWITKEALLRTCSVVHLEYTTRKIVSKPLPSPNLDGHLPLCPQYPRDRHGDEAFFLMTDAMPVELCVLPLQIVGQDQANSVQDQRVST